MEKNQGAACRTPVDVGKGTLRDEIMGDSVTRWLSDSNWLDDILFEC